MLGPAERCGSTLQTLRTGVEVTLSSRSPTLKRRFIEQRSNGVGGTAIRGFKEAFMAEAKTAVAHKPIWTDLSTSDPAGARDFYAKVFGWKVEVNPDPQYGGYALAKIGGKDVAGIGPKQMDEAPTAWTVYIGSADAEGTTKKAQAAGGKVIVPT